MKTYEVGYCICTIEKTSSGYYAVVVKDTAHGTKTENMFSTKEQALEEILSYAEIENE